MVVARGVGKGGLLGDVLDGDQPLQAILAVDHQQALQAMLVQQRLRGLQRGALGHGDQLVARRHDVAHRRVIAGLEPQVAPGDDAHHAPLIDDRKAADVQLVRQLHHLEHRVLRRDDHRIAQHAAFVALDLGHLRGLLLCGQVLVHDADAALLRHGDGQARLGDGVHRRRDQRQLQADATGELRGEVDVLGQDLGERWHQQHIVEGQRLADQAHGKGLQKTDCKQRPPFPGPTATPTQHPCAAQKTRRSANFYRSRRFAVR